MSDQLSRNLVPCVARQRLKTAGGVFMAGTLGVDTIAYAPWAIMCYTSFLVAIFYAYTGIAIAPRRNEDETQPGS